MLLISKIRKCIHDISTDKKRRIYLLGAIMALALVARIIFIATLEEKFYFFDATHYDSAARGLVSGKGFTLDYKFFNTNKYCSEPVYPLYLAAHYKVFGNTLLIVRLCQALLGALTCLLVYLLGKKIWGIWPGLIAAGICAIYPSFVFVSGLIYPEQLFMTLIVGGLLCLYNYNDTRKMRYLLASGACLGVALMTKGILIAFMPFLGLWFLLYSKMPSVKSKLISAGVIYALVICAMIPWTIRNYNVSGRWSVIRTHTTMVLDKKYAREQEGVLSHMVSEGFGVGRFLKEYAEEFIQFWSLYPGKVQSDNEYTSTATRIVSIVATLPVFVFAFLGIWAARKKFCKEWLMIFLIFSFAFAYSFFVTHMRYRIPVEPYIILFAGLGVTYVFERVNKKITENAKLNYS